MPEEKKIALLNEEDSSYFISANRNTQSPLSGDKSQGNDKRFRTLSNISLDQVRNTDSINSCLSSTVDAASASIPPLNLNLEYTGQVQNYQSWPSIFLHCEICNKWVETHPLPLDQHSINVIIGQSVSMSVLLFDLDE